MKIENVHWIHFEIILIIKFDINEKKYVVILISRKLIKKVSYKTFKKTKKKMRVLPSSGVLNILPI